MRRGKDWLGIVVLASIVGVLVVFVLSAFAIGTGTATMLATGIAAIGTLLAVYVALWTLRESALRAEEIRHDAIRPIVAIGGTGSCVERTLMVGLNNEGNGPAFRLRVFATNEDNVEVELRSNTGTTLRIAAEERAHAQFRERLRAAYAPNVPTVSGGVSILGAWSGGIIESPSMVFAATADTFVPGTRWRLTIHMTDMLNWRWQHEQVSPPLVIVEKSVEENGLVGYFDLALPVRVADEAR
jgi:hypothetical protein